ncbi:MBL fold metallo-hydrolase [Croceicoccus sediminis]|uniref:MBL fold metallo-hydrolase n=1 Tax=Croceicoccus sediminis TaxID=2571150 RepID=UPI001F0FBB6B|nr:MBL fold metallo-hydrolase [Croceicoccus sediminis]
MKKITAAAALAGMIATGLGPASAQDASKRAIPSERQGDVDESRSDSPNGGRPEIRTHEDMAVMAPYTAPGARTYSALAVDASDSQWPVTLYYRCKYPRGGTSINAPVPQPMEVFDDVYSIGDDANNIWAIDTSEGIILIDALTTEEDARNIIVRHMKQVGLDPARISLIIVTHEHGDHYGGAPYMKSLSGAPIAATQEAWDSKPSFGPPMPVRGPDDLLLVDGQEITIGDRTITVVATPGHTRGTVSLVFPVSDHGTPHVAALFGGQGKPRAMADYLEFRRGLNHFAEYTDRMQADVILSNHTVGDDGLTRIDQLARRQPGDPNPYVVGREGVIRYDALFRACLSADIDQMTYDAMHEGESDQVPPPTSASDASPLSGDHLVTQEMIDGWKHSLSNWGRWGSDDEKGTLNFITPQVRQRAAKEVRRGLSVSLERAITPVHIAPDHEGPLPRAAVVQRMLSGPPKRTTGSTDQLSIVAHGYTETHLDAFGHHFHDGKMYNGFAVSDHVSMDEGLSRGSIAAFSEGVFTRGVLVDIPMLRGVAYLEPGTPIYVEDLEAWEKFTGVRIGPGDAVFIRTGRWQAEAERGPWDIANLAAGLDASVIPWLHERDIALVGTESAMSVKPFPDTTQIDNPDDYLPAHNFALVTLGMPLIDNADLDALSQMARSLDRYTFLLTVAPIRVTTGTGATVNPIATF